LYYIVDFQFIFVLKSFMNLLGSGQLIRIPGNSWSSV
jgi:hypothetical protein